MDRWSDPQEQRYLGLTATQLNLAFFAVVGAVGLAIFIYIGGVGAVRDFLGNQPSSPNPAVAETATPTSTLTAQEAADAALLTLDDLPSGWTLAPPDDDDDDADLAPVSEECQALSDKYDHLSGELASAESDEFEGPDEQEVNSSASVFSTETAAQEALDAYDSLFTSCGDELVTVFETALHEELQEDSGDASSVGLDVSFQELAFPQLGDATSAYRLGGTVAMEGIAFEFALDFAVMREGRMVGGLTYFAIGNINPFEEEEIAETAAEKLENANAALAE